MPLVIVTPETSLSRREKSSVDDHTSCPQAEVACCRTCPQSAALHQHQVHKKNSSMLMYLELVMVQGADVGRLSVG